ncbi:MAG: Mrp protein homolog, partial [uncultured Solirubrobacteraceae bacterium]
ADPRRDPQRPRARHRPRAAPLDRRARDGALDRDRRGGDGRRHRLADDRRMPDPQPLRGGRHARGEQRRRRRGRQRGLRRPLRQREVHAAEVARSRLVAGRRARAGRQRPVRRLGQGRCRQVDAHGQPRRRADAGRQVGRHPRRRRLGLLDPAHVRPRRRAPAGLPRQEDPADAGPRREGHVDRLLRRGGCCRRLARADAAQGAHAVPRGRRVGGARLPARRPAAGHRRRLDDARPAAAAGAVRDRDDAAADGAEGRPPRRADGGQGLARDRGHRREHGRLHDAVGRALPDLRRGRRPGACRRARRAAARQGPADDAPPHPGRRRHAACLHRSRRPCRAGDPPCGPGHRRAGADRAAGIAGSGSHRDQPADGSRL